MLRRWFLAVVIVTLPAWNWSQIQTIVQFNVFMMIYQGYFKPYKYPEQNRKELANEAFIMLNSYFLFIFYDFVPDADTRYFMGWFNVGCLGLMVGFNTVIIAGG